MSAAAEGVRALLAVKIKPRDDSYCDQFIRIFMLKVMLAGTLLLSLNWYTDKVNCIIPDSLKIDGGFVSSSCWINGLYVYKDIRYHVNEVGYYGVPRDIMMNGRDTDGQLCGTKDSSHRKNPECREMEKTFFLQYQYIAFLLLALSLLYYAPYFLFKKVNEDIVSLKGSIQGADGETIVKNYFNEKINPTLTQRIRILGELIVKMLYICSTISVFIILNSILNQGFTNFGAKWLTWSKLNNSLTFDYMGRRHFPKPGEELFPSFGFCEVWEGSQDVKLQITNNHKFLCEISQHVLYHYTFLVIWFAIVASMVVAVLGMLHLLYQYFSWCCCATWLVHPTHRSIYRSLSLREVQYLEYIRTKNSALHIEVVQQLKGNRGGGLLGEEVRPHQTDTL